MNPTSKTPTQIVTGSKDLLNIGLYSTSFTMGPIAIGALVVASCMPLAQASGGSGLRPSRVPQKLDMIECAISEAAGDDDETVESEDDGGVEGIVNQIHWIMTDASARDEDEAAPAQRVAENITLLLQGTEGILGYSLPSGDASSFYGELSVTWRHSNKIVSLICTALGELRLHSGTMKENQPGEYTHLPVVGAPELANQLAWLMQAEEPSVVRAAY
jgi:hypothetical protein